MQSWQAVWVIFFRISVASCTLANRVAQETFLWTYPSPMAEANYRRSWRWASPHSQKGSIRMPHGKTKKLAIIFPHRMLGLVCSSAGPPPLPMILPQLVRQPPSRMWSTLSPTTIEGGSFSPSHLLPLPPPPPPPPPHPHP